MKEILLPTGAICGQVDLVSDVTFEGYYQYEWKETELNGVGSFSVTAISSDRSGKFLISLGPDNFLVAPGPGRGASDSGRVGLGPALDRTGRYRPGLYYINAHSKAPAYRLNYNGVASRDYTIVYFEDIQGYATSFTTVMADAMYRVKPPTKRACRSYYSAVSPWTATGRLSVGRFLCV